MIITRKAIPRRALLCGLGAAVALPLLDGMAPALTALSRSAARPVRRFGVVYVPNGVVIDQWTPATTGAGFELSPILKPLEPFRDRLLVLTGLTQNVNGLTAGSGAVHGRCATKYLTGAIPRPLRAGGERLSCRRLARPARRAAARTGHGARIAGAVAGVGRQGGRHLRRRV